MHTPVNLWNSTCSVLKHVQTVVNGEAIYTDGARTYFRCRVQILSGEEALRQDGDRSKYYAKVYCSPGLDVSEDDHIVLADGAEWFISSIRDPDAMHAFLTIDCNRPVVENDNGL